MNETKQMAKEIRMITVVLTAILFLLSFVIFPGMRKSVCIGILIGSLTGLLGFHMILQMTNSIHPDMIDVKSKAYRSYTQRYLVYAAIFGLSAYLGVNVIALLAGMLAHKASLLIYTWIHRKEDD